MFRLKNKMDASKVYSKFLKIHRKSARLLVQLDNHSSLKKYVFAPSVCAKQLLTPAGSNKKIKKTQTPWQTAVRCRRALSRVKLAKATRSM